MHVLLFVSLSIALVTDLSPQTFAQKESYRIEGNFRIEQILAYFEHMQTVRKLEPTKIIAPDYEITWFFLRQQLSFITVLQLSL